MWNNNLKAHVLSACIINDIEDIIKNNSLQSLEHSLDELRKAFPSLNDKELVDLLDTIIHTYNFKLTEKVELVATLPTNYKVQALPTISAIDDLISNSQRLIIMTGYSISDYAEEILSKIIDKSRSGVMVKIFVNDFKPSESLLINKLDLFKGRYLEIYKYSEKDDEMAALHAKTISIDDSRTLITSANLSFHGLEKNIELGCLIQSRDYARKIHSLFSELIKTRKVLKIY